ncbi:MAG: magnesium transporter CorA family protein [Patescibacteria group bacterium]|nr:magnesium transporter CorA family protein [Patescibacteria group bacterium]MDD5567264.1 magnesium transporter CorA family protein [Patescibacteria group bacterium]
MNVKTLQVKDLRWVNVVKPTNEEIEYLRKNFSFHPLDLNDCLSSPAQRPNLDKYTDYMFMILLFPVFDRKTREIKPSEVDFFIGKDYLVTVHQDNLPPLIDLFELCSANEQAKDKYLQEGVEKLLFTILNSLFLYCYPMLDHVSMDIAQLENKIFSGNEKKTVREITVIRRNITSFRRIMQTHKNVLKKLTRSYDSSVFKLNGLKLYFEQLIEDSKDIWDTLQGFKEGIETLQQTNESLISFRINDIIKTLTIISALVLPVYVTASIFGLMKGYFPVLGETHNFWLPLALCFGSALSMYWFMKKKNMLK